MRVLCLTKYTRAGPSSRYRTYLYLDALRARGHTVEVCPLFEDDYIEALFAGRRSDLSAVLRASFRRVARLLARRDHDVCVLEYELLPFLPAGFEGVLLERARPFVVDLDDAVFHRYDLHRRALVRALLGRKFSAVARRAACVIAGNSYLADYMVDAGADRVELLPTVLDLQAYPCKSVTRESSNGRPVIGWMGTPSTARYLQEIGPALRCAEAHGARIRVVGARTFELTGVDVELVPWSEDGEVDLLQTFDVGVMPLPDEPWARGKCGFKLIQYMAAGLPTVASPVGVNSEIVVEGATGRLATTRDEWSTALLELCGDAALRARMGASGRKRVEERYCLDVTAPRYVEILESVAASHGRH